MFAADQQNRRYADWESESCASASDTPTRNAETRGARTNDAARTPASEQVAGFKASPRYRLHGTSRYDGRMVGFGRGSVAFLGMRLSADNRWASGRGKCARRPYAARLLVTPLRAANEPFPRCSYL